MASSPARVVGDQAPVALPAGLPAHLTDSRVAGLGAITAATAEGISVNVTLVFGLKRYAAGGGRPPPRARAGRHHRCRFDDGPICRISLCLTRRHGDGCALEQGSYRRGPSTGRQ